MKINRLGVRGFTITELLVVTIVIAVLASLTFILYTGVQTKLIDASISADAESMNSSELLYKLSHNSIAKAYYSGNGPDSELNFSPKTGNIIDVVISGKEFCIRVYNPKGTKNSIYNAYQVESRLGLCYELPPSYDAASAATPSVPDAPNITVALDGSNIVATIAPVTCAVGTVQYGINSRTNDGAWTGFTDWSEVITASQAVSEGVKYGYQAQARCYISVTAVYGDAAVGIENTYTHLFAPSAPNITVAQNSGNIDATIIPVSCTVGTVQYEINNRIDNGAWSGYTTWSIDTTATQVATGGEGVKYSYQAQARCYVGNNELSPIATGPEGNYISPITTPSNPIVSASTTAGYVTTYSWGAASCASGTTARYQYRFIITPSGYDSDWVAIGGTSIDFSTSTGGETYDLQVQAQCYNDNASSSWSGSGSASYFCVGDANPIATSISGYWSTAPSGYLLEDGSAISRTTYADLFTAIGTTYGAGDGSTTFNLPDSRGRVAVNKNSTDTEFDTLGEKYGEKSHTLTGAESGEKGHNHAQDAHSHGISDPSHRHTAAGGNFSTPSGSFYGLATAGQSTGSSATGITINNATATNQAIASSNASSAHNNIQPSIVENFAIRY